MTTPTPGEREARRQHEHWAAAHARLVDGPAPAAKPRRERPVSPFREKNKTVERLREKAAQSDPAVLTVFPNLFTEVSASYPPSSVVEPAVYLAGEIGRVSWREIVAEVCRKHEVNFIDLRSPRRDRPTTTARQEAFWRVRHETTMSLPQIGSKFGRDHTTVLHGIRRHEERMREASNGAR